MPWLTLVAAALMLAWLENGPLAAWRAPPLLLLALALRAAAAGWGTPALLGCLLVGLIGDLNDPAGGCFRTLGFTAAGLLLPRQGMAIPGLRRWAVLIAAGFAAALGLLLIDLQLGERPRWQDEFIPVLVSAALTALLLPLLDWAMGPLARPGAPPRPVGT